MTAPPDQQDTTRSSPLTRRAALVLGAGALLSGGAIAAQWFNVLARNGVKTMTPSEAHAAAGSGDLLLVDIRRPEEWARTGVGESATAIDMRRPDFVRALRVEAGTEDRRIALICARGVRSRRLGVQLEAAGFQRIIDVPEGMLGSGAGPGWIAAGLPLRSPDV